MTDTIQATGLFAFAEFRSDGSTIPQSGNDVLVGGKGFDRANGGQGFDRCRASERRWQCER